MNIAQNAADSEFDSTMEWPRRGHQRTKTDRKSSESSLELPHPLITMTFPMWHAAYRWAATGNMDHRQLELNTEPLIIPEGDVYNSGERSKDEVDVNKS